ncbi:MAG TPA: aspartate kinase, partial [Candidatus Handelsmanbacteria bacterium]|nr:aspartate kinase [Candidatus Handelsmanbacteria bacterium]
MKTVKFGGSSLASAEQVRKVCEIVNADPARRLVVVSAPGRRADDDTKVTDLLILAAEARLSHQPGTQELSRVIERFADLAAGLGLGQDIVESIRQDLQQRLAADHTDTG